MKIGLLAYHSACNMGATLQLLSSYCYWKKAGHEPIIINWIPQDLEEYYIRSTPPTQRELQVQLRQQLWKETDLCRTIEEVARVIEKEKIEAVVIGSDSVAQHHTFHDRIIFPTRRIYYIRSYTSDRLFPNPFWGAFNKYLAKPVPVAVLSAASQDSDFEFYSRKLNREMYDAIRQYTFLSVRDVPTQKMMRSISKGKIVPAITPDPVFALNTNAEKLIPTREEITKKYNLPQKYLVCSFIHPRVVSAEWLTQFEQEALQQGYECVILPFSQHDSYGSTKHTIHLPLSPLDWYAIIKYSGGYIGNNMHPIVVALHNAIPFFSIDNYGKRRLNGLITNYKNSKIYQIIAQAGLESNYVSCISKFYTPPTPSLVLDRIMSFDYEKVITFRDNYYNLYLQTMQQIEKSIQHA